MEKCVVVISPCRDEEAFIEKTLTSVTNQSRKPDRWIIVDDGSRDRTQKIIARYAARHSWIELVQRDQNTQRGLGPEIVDVFNYGYEFIGDDSYDIVAKLDCDLQFGSNCFAAILSHFEDPKVGMASGAIYTIINNKPILERYANFHVPGAVKFYRRNCFEQIGGLKKIVGWDIIDETDARRHGWITVSDPKIEIMHLRQQANNIGVLKGRFKWGQGSYAIGSHPLFAIGRSIFRMMERPRIVGGIALMFGFFSSYLNRKINRNMDLESIHYLRQEQVYRLFHGNKIPRSIY